MSDQLSFFGQVEDGIPRLRPYQQEAVTACIRNWAQGNQSSLLVMATGLGKTQVFCEVIRRYHKKCPDKRVVILAPRGELVDQAYLRLKEFKLNATIDKADKWSDRSPIIVATHQTLANERRLRFAERLGEPGLIVVDEVHGVPCETFRRPLDRWRNALRLGVTATPTRSDGRSIGDLFPSVTFSMGVLEGIAGGWLSPVRARTVVLGDLDLDHVSVSGADFSAAALDQEILKVCEGIAEYIVKHGGSRKGLIFAPGLKTAEYLSEALNRRKPGSARFVAGVHSDRSKTIGDFKRGEYQYLCNVALLTEGTDIPDVDMVVMARPTKSAKLFIQCVGRGLRKSPGKSHCLLLDFAGLSKNHTLVTPVDLFGHGGYTPKERERAAEKLQDEEMDVEDALKGARRELAQIAATVRLKEAGTVSHEWNPFQELKISDYGCSLKESGFMKATEGQVKFLTACGINEGEARELPRKLATRMCAKLNERRKAGKATLGQLKYLKFAGEEVSPSITFGEASKLISIIKGREKIDASS